MKIGALIFVLGMSCADATTFREAVPTSYDYPHACGYGYSPGPRGIRCAEHYACTPRGDCVWRGYDWNGPGL